MASPTIAHADIFHGNSTSASSLVMNPTAAVPQNDSLILGIDAGNAQTISSVVDSQGNPWAKDTTASQNGSGAARLDIWTCRVKFPLTTSDTITITLTGATNIAAQAIHLSGAVIITNSANGRDQVKTGTGAGTNSPTTGASPTLAVADELSIGFIAYTGNTTGFSAESTGYTSRADQGNATGSIHIGTKAITAVASPGTETYAPTLTGTPTNSTLTLITVRGQTVRYVNVSTGSDANSGLFGGGGTAFANAKLTIAACGALPGDIVHIARTPAPSASAGTSTWTTGSTTVSTSSDLTGSIAAKDLVSSTADGTGGFWEVSSITSSAITLVSAYRPGPAGLTGSGLSLYALTSAGGFYIGFNTAGNIQALVTDATKEDPISIIGGYTTSTDTRDGFTWMANTNATRQGIFSSNHSFHNVSYIGMARTARGFSDTSGGQGVHWDHCQVASSNGESFYKLTSDVRYSNCVVQPQGNQDGFSHAAGSNSASYYDTCYVLNSGTNSAFNDTNGAHSTYVNCYADGAATGFTLSVSQPLLYNCTANHTTTGFSITSTQGGDARFSGCVSSNASSRDWIDSSSLEPFYIYLFNCLGNSSTVLARSNGTIMNDKYQQTNGDYRQYTIQGSILTNTAQARTGTCTEIQPGQGLNIDTNKQSAATASDFATRPDKFMEETWAIPVEAGATRTITVYVKKSSTLTAYTCLLGIMANGYWVGGALPTNIAVNVGTGATTILSTTYQQYSFTYNNSSGPDQVIDLAVWLDGSAGSLYVDDIAWS